MKHWWFSGRMLACHAGGPGSIPGQCIFTFFYLYYFNHHFKDRIALILAIIKKTDLNFQYFSKVYYVSYLKT